MTTSQEYSPLYAVLPNGMKSKNDIVPFAQTETSSAHSTSHEGNLLQANIFDSTGGIGIGLFMWITFPLLILSSLFISLLLQKRDVVLYAIPKNEVKKIRVGKLGGLFSYVSSLPLSKQDLQMRYVGIYEQSEHGEGHLELFGKILELRCVDLGNPNGPSEVSVGNVNKNKLSRYQVHYIFEEMSGIHTEIPAFSGKEYVDSEKFLKQMGLIGKIA